MPMPIMDPVEIHPVSRQNPMHEAAKITARGFHYQMKMVGHQAEQIDSHLAAFRSLTHARQQIFTIPVSLKQTFFAIRPDRNVIDRAGIFHSELSRHA